MALKSIYESSKQQKLRLRWRHKMCPQTLLLFVTFHPPEKKNKKTNVGSLNIRGRGSQVSISEDSSLLSYECNRGIDYCVYPPVAPLKREWPTHRGSWRGRIGWPCSLWHPSPLPSALSNLVMADCIRGGLLTHPRQPVWPSDVWPSTRPIRFLLSQCWNKKDLVNKITCDRSLSWKDVCKGVERRVRALKRNKFHLFLTFLGNRNYGHKWVSWLGPSLRLSSAWMWEGRSHLSHRSSALSCMA